MDKLTPSNASRLLEHIEKSHGIQCAFCNEQQYVAEEEVRSEQKTASQILAMEGWRSVLSNKFTIDVPACPVCAKKKDEDR